MSHTHTYFSSHLSPQFDIYFGLLLFCGFILFDTQLIVERFSRGDSDYIWHSVDLFLDFVNIFVRLLAILASKVPSLPSPPLSNSSFLCSLPLV